MKGHHHPRFQQEGGSLGERKGFHPAAPILQPPPPFGRRLPPTVHLTRALSGTRTVHCRIESSGLEYSRDGRWSVAIIVGQARVRFRRGVEMWTHSKIWDTSNFLSSNLLCPPFRGFELLALIVAHGNGARLAGQISGRGKTPDCWNDCWRVANVPRFLEKSKLVQKLDFTFRLIEYLFFFEARYFYTSFLR